MTVIVQDNSYWLRWKVKLMDDKNTFVKWFVCKPVACHQDNGQPGFTVGAGYSILFWNYADLDDQVCSDAPLGYHLADVEIQSWNKQLATWVTLGIMDILSNIS